MSLCITKLKKIQEFRKYYLSIELSKFGTTICFKDITGFVRLRENLENLGKGTFLKRIRENLENSGNFPTIFTTSGKTQGILFCQISLIKYVVLSE